MLCGCSSFNSEVRAEHGRTYLERLAEETETAVGTAPELGLEDCVRLALENNLSIQSAEIEARIARLERKVAFANFLPTLNLSLSYTTLDRQPESQMFGGLAIPVQDRSVRDMAWQVQMPIFLPATWFLYAMRTRGAEIGEYVLDYTRQMITLQVTVLYFHCLALEETERTLENDVATANALFREVAAYRTEGLVSQWQVDQANAFALAQQTGLNATQRLRRQAEADLLGAMGLSPLAELTLSADEPLEAPPESLEDLILRALQAHPQLHIADRAVEIQRERVKMAIAEFLPKLLGFASRTNTSNSFMKYRNSWITGLTGVLTVFDGFANVREYQIAREQRQAAYIQREDASLSIMLQVIKARLNQQDAQERLALAKKLLEVADGKLAEIEARWREGMITPSDRLSALAERETARANVTNARFQQQVSIASLLNVLGAGYAGNEVRSYEEEL